MRAVASESVNCPFPQVCLGTMQGFGGGWVGERTSFSGIKANGDESAVAGDGGVSSHWRNALAFAEMTEDRRHCRPQQGLTDIPGRESCEGAGTGLQLGMGTGTRSLWHNSENVDFCGLDERIKLKDNSGHLERAEAR